ncbi:hypothetical protein BKA67DRAFT_517316 [Truncatella angustata]|uniref:mRNA 3'-end-processing protein RNA14 n=1 Tax=Truncatella angustata TaxID=152316 RepID=A0A9P8UKV0_9PEZI|nr:uncharacterized protein BKA67DRAFT_517316 [Truncatella angustata]KAH6653827.1 hypothetical protein BKA67DRAFT_517316 [Truncatella angustata]
MEGGNEAAETLEQNSHQQTQEPSTSTVPPFVPGESPEEDDADSGEYDPEYDPESVVMSTTVTPAPQATATHPPPPANATTSSPRPTKKPKKAGGFIVGSSDDEDEDTPAPTPAPVPQPSPAATLQPQPIQAAAEGPAPAFSHSPLQQTALSQVVPAAAAAASVPAPQVSNGQTSSTHLPTDIVSILEDRLKNDPRGDMDAWLALIEETRRRNVIQDSRSVYERFLENFPQSAEVWVQYLQLELSLDNFGEAENIFQRTLTTIVDVQLWTAYLDYVRRRNDLNDTTGAARQTVNAAYDFVLDNVGQDRESGRIWQDYIQFLKISPGQVGGSGWQDMQKVDTLRKAYQRAICIPISNLNQLWKEYDQFELGINKVAGRKFLQERSPAYMSARSANTQLDTVTRGLNRTSIPRLPPAPGFEGDLEFNAQVELWKKWIAWEKSDPLVLKDDEPETFKSRIIYVYKQALMALRFWPELWVEAAEWCFEQKILAKDGNDEGLLFLSQGVAANPESTLLALKHADHIESTHPAGEGDAGKLALSQAVRVPYDQALTSLYALMKKLKERETAAIKSIENDPYFTVAADQEEDDEGEVSENSARDNAKKDRIKAVQDGFAVQIHMLKQQISHLWIALARAFRRIQGQGKATSREAPSTGVRQIFTEARQRGQLTSDVYVAIAHIEWDIYQDPVATKIFERGAKLFPEDEHFVVAYLKHLHSRHDTTNARVVFSQTVKKFKEKPELVLKLKPLYAYFHKYEATFGELAQIKDLEKQMAESFPEDPTLSHFAARFSSDRFNPIAARVIISPAAQMRPKHIMQSVEQMPGSMRGSPHPSVLADRSPRPQFLPAVNSPKRPFQPDDDDVNPPRKVARGVSPLKGAAGRRLDQQRRAQGQGVVTSTGPAPISRDITFLLGLIPPSQQYAAPRYKPDGMVRILRDTVVPDFNDWKASNQGARHSRQVSSEFASYSLPAGGRNSPFMTAGSGTFQPPMTNEANPANFYSGAFPYNMGQQPGIPQYHPFRQG